MHKNTKNKLSFSPFILTLVSAILFMLSFPNFVIENGIQGLGSLALVPVFFALARAHSRKHTLILGAVFGITTTTLAYFWLTRFKNYSVWALGGVGIGYACEYALVFLVLHMIIHRTPYKKHALPLAIVWTAYEYLKSIGFLGFPWTLLAQSIHEVLPLMQLANITGVWGVSFLLALCNGLFYTSIRHATSKAQKEKRAYASIRKQWLVLCAALVIIFGYGMYTLHTGKTRPIKQHISMLLVQQNVDSWEYIDEEGIIHNLEKIIHKTKDSIETNPKKPQLIVWSEASLNTPYQPGLREDWDELYAHKPDSLPFRSLLQNYNIPILSGSTQFDEQDNSLAYNSAILIHPNGTLLGSYAKYQLVPFAELVPLYQFKIIRTFMNNVIKTSGTWSRKKESFTPLTLNNYDGQGSTLFIGTPICFEDSFPYITRAMTNNGADVLINLTNVSWSSSRSAQVQQLAAAKFRSIETGLPLVRSTNSGITTMIDPWGRITKSLPMFTEATLDIDVPIYEKQRTLYLLIGDSFAYLMVLATAYIIFSLRKRRS